MKFLPCTILALCTFLSACSEKPVASPVKKEEFDAKPQLVGRIASISADRDFVLIQSYGKWTVETGSILTIQSPDGRAANLIATGEKLGQFAAADLRTGEVEIGDGVYTIAKFIAPKDESAAPPAESPEGAEPRQ